MEQVELTIEEMAEILLKTAMISKGDEWDEWIGEHVDALNLAFLIRINCATPTDKGLEMMTKAADTAAALVPDHIK